MNEIDKFYKRLYESVASVKELKEALEEQKTFQLKNAQVLARGELSASEVERVERRVKKAHERVSRFRQIGFKSLH